jgi:DDE_Tnp_1-associated
MTSINLDKSLIDYLKQIPDQRVPNGRRHPLWLILLIMILGIMSGYWGYRGLGRFVERHRRQLIEILDIPQARVPSYSTIRRVMMNLDYQAVTQVFNDWASHCTNNQQRQWVALDGKSLKNTVSDCYAKEQNFVMMVSAFSHYRGEILGIKVMENKKQSEIVAVQELLELLNLSGVVFTMDALHCQKKLSRRLSPMKMTI